ncbi:MAG: phosphoribosylanthranilate isomerase [Pseudomonadota bacterium]
MSKTNEIATIFKRPTVKICGLSTPAAGIAGAEAGASLIGFTFVEQSPRCVRASAAAALAGAIRKSTPVAPHFVGLFVDADDETMRQAVPHIDAIQCHGSETPERVLEIKKQFALPVIKALPIGEEKDVQSAIAFEECADALLFDAQPPEGATTSGGNGEVFDWSLLTGYSGKTPYLLAGGLTPSNVAEAISMLVQQSAFIGVDVSSGVEARKGIKDLGKVRTFTHAALDAFA